MACKRSGVQIPLAPRRNRRSEAISGEAPHQLSPQVQPKGRTATVGSERVRKRLPGGEVPVAGAGRATADRRSEGEGSIDRQDEHGALHEERQVKGLPWEPSGGVPRQVQPKCSQSRERRGLSWTNSRVSARREERATGFEVRRGGW